jgi:AhpD family alkylhydroperoxidase
LRVDYRLVLPTATSALKSLDEAAHSVPLDARLLELLKLRASQLNGCAHCVELHTDTARTLGEDERRLALVSVWRTSSAFSGRERAALRWCEALTHLGTSTDDAFVELATFFRDEEIVGLTFAIIAINGWNRLRIGLDAPRPTEEPVDLPSGAGPASDPTARALAAHLRVLEEEIAQARQAYRNVTSGPPSPRYYESGTVHPELDDQSIAP